jgi:Flp pilus assembly protein TadG
VRRRRDDGVTTVEFALVLPIFVFLIGIATYFAWMFYIQSQVNRAADRAARYAAVPYTTTTTSQYNVDINGNVYGPGVVISAGTTIVNAYSKTQVTRNYHFCETEVVSKVNRDLVGGNVALPAASADPTTYDVQVSDGSRNAVTGNPNGPISVSAACSKPSGYVKVKVSKNFKNPFAVLVAPFTGSTDELTVTGTGRARVESE